MKIMTSDDIFLEIGGKRVAGVESYGTRYSNDVKTHDAFGEQLPIGFSDGSRKFTVDVTRMYLEDTAIKDGIDFYTISDFNFVVDKGGKRTVFGPCRISEVSEDGALKDRVAEKVSILALKRWTE